MEGLCDLSDQSLITAIFSGMLQTSGAKGYWAKVFAAAKRKIKKIIFSSRHLCKNYFIRITFLARKVPSAFSATKLN